jgi:DUF1680 family protein
MDTDIVRTMWLPFVLAWFNALFTTTGDARPLDLAELLIYNSGYASPPPQLIYAATDTTLFVNFFAASEQTVRVGKFSVRATQRTDFPRNGEIELRVEPDQPSLFTLAVRIPGWARGELTWSSRHQFELPDVPAATLIVNGAAVRMRFDRGFAKVTREWRRGDVVHVYFPMPEHRIVPGDAGCAAMQHGPLIVCRG